MNFLGVSNSDSKILNWTESWPSWQCSSLPITMFELIKKMLPENTTNHLYKFAPSLLFPGSSSLRHLRCWPTSWCGTCLRLSRGRSTGTCCFTASSSQCRRWVRCHSLCCPWLKCALMSLTMRFHPFAVLSCAILGSHHVHQQGPERERLCNCLSYVSVPAWSESIFSQVLLLLLLSSLSVYLSGMTVEVLGTVLGTAIQGQIVGGAPDCPTELDVINSEYATENMTTAPLEETVNVLLFACHRVSAVLGYSHKMMARVDPVFPSPETSLHDCFRGHLHHLHPLRRCVIFRGEGAKRYEALTQQGSSH